MYYIILGKLEEKVRRMGIILFRVRNMTAKIIHLPRYLIFFTVNYIIDIKILY